MARVPVPPILRVINMLETPNTVNGAVTAVVIPSGRFMANMLFSAICSVGVTGLFIEMIIMLTGPLWQATGPITVEKMSMGQGVNLQSEQTRIFLSAKWQNSEGRNLDFQNESTAALAEAELLMAAGEVSEVLESKVFLSEI